ncbi:uncharacterized protein AB675_7500 [Cyphellophora attinorum]|uniref:F-box domain-containing protein n=1 Tax=Cyphellophora attinorum TaxID=1664694 RepID=A0A0N1HBC9_9EURO|nr:uncharacterized protein AB675_7500 [Phialophora attinorum]KPI40517.1 hypothetical protein AB675_7500 [Phialophora attinorum]
MAVTRSQTRALCNKPVANLAQLPIEMLERILCEALPEIVEFHVCESRQWLGRRSYSVMWEPNWVIGLLVVCKSVSGMAKMVIREREVITMCGWQGIIGGRFVTREAFESSWIGQALKRKSDNCEGETDGSEQ